MEPLLSEITDKGNSSAHAGSCGGLFRPAVKRFLRNDGNELLRHIGPYARLTS